GVDEVGGLLQGRVRGDRSVRVALRQRLQQLGQVGGRGEARLLGHDVSRLCDRVDELPVHVRGGVLQGDRRVVVAHGREGGRVDARRRTRDGEVLRAAGDVALVVELRRVVVAGG